MNDALLLVAAGVGAGLLGAAFGMSSLISYPALLIIGLPPALANVTNTVALIGVGVGSTAGSIPELRGKRPVVVRLCMINTIGGMFGAVLLLVLPAETFEAAVPWLVIGASVLMLFPARRSHGEKNGEVIGLGAWPGLTSAAVYAGYFGAAAGVVLLAVLRTTTSMDLQELIALKNVATGVANISAAGVFVVSVSLAWTVVVPLSLGFVLGGWMAPPMIRRMPVRTLRPVLALGGLLVAGWMFSRA